MSREVEWDEHWGDYAEANTLNPAQSYRRRLILEALALHQSSSARILELGSGQGELALEILGQFPKVEFVGLDLSKTGCDIARRRVGNAEFFDRDLTAPIELPEGYRAWATLGVCTEMLEHVDDPGRVLRNAKHLFARGARLVITVPAGPVSAFDRHLGHRAHFTPQRLEEVIRSAGYDVLQLSAAGFPFFNLYRLTVIARGQALVRDARAITIGKAPLAARVAMQAFDRLFRFNRGDSRFGWQLVAVVQPRE